jgi:DNA-binding XRE family transcriptional regulator
MTSAIKNAAYREMRQAFKLGQLVRQPCEMCGINYGVDAHHDDYGKALDVRFLCRFHHQYVHSLRREKHLDPPRSKRATQKARTLLMDARIAAGLTQEALAAKAGVPQETISSIELGRSKQPVVDTAQRLAKALRLSVADLWPVDDNRDAA